LREYLYSSFELARWLKEGGSLLLIGH
jgi:hypothetical protein